MIADMDLCTIQNGAEDVHVDVIADVDVVPVDAMERGLDDGVVADVTEELAKDTLTVRHSLCEIVAPEQPLGILALGVQVSIKTVVDLSGEHLLAFCS
jgi:hypothetical protein